MREIRVDAFSKLTLSLKVTGTRPDGYHELDALMVSVTEPHDSLRITLEGDRWGGVGGDVTGPFALASGPVTENLAVRAASAFREGFAFRGGIDISLHKGIPAGAGLGGGSADAAAVLVGLRALFAADNVTDDVLMSVGSTLGADVAFCVRGGAARVHGIGDVIVPTEIDPLIVVVATPRFACATSAVYRSWDDLGGPRGTDVEIEGLGIVRNDLEPAAVAMEPRLREFKSAVENAAGRAAVLAGSGSSYAVVFEHVAEAERARLRVSESIEGSVWLGTTTSAGHALNP